MPIVPPGSIDSPGDDLFSAFSAIGSAIPRILDPRRDVRSRAMDLMNDPDKIKPILARLYANSLVPDGEGGVKIDEVIYDEGVRAFAASIGLRPDNAQEFAVIRPIIDAGVAAIPASEKVSIETGVATKGMAQARELEAKKTEAGIAGFEATTQEDRNKTAFFTESARLGTPAKTAQVQYEALENEGRMIEFQRGFMTGLLEAGQQDETLANLIAVGDKAAIANYLAQLKLQALRLAAQVKAGGVKGITPIQQRSYLSTRRSELSEARRHIEDLVISGGQEAQIRNAIDAYNNVKDEYLMMNGAFGLTDESFASTPTLIHDEHTLFHPFKGVLRVEWANQTIPVMEGLSSFETQSLNRIVSTVISTDPLTADNKLAAEYNNAGSTLRAKLDAVGYQDGLDFIFHQGIQGRIRLSNFEDAYMAHRAPVRVPTPEPGAGRPVDPAVARIKEQGR